MGFYGFIRSSNLPPIDLEHFVQDLSSRLKEEDDFENEMQILQNALDFSNIKARDCMIPRTEIIAVEVEEEIETLKNPNCYFLLLLQR